MENTWPSNKSEILFLGRWCLLHNRRKFWNSFNYTVAEYHWNDRYKLYKDYQYIQKIYDDLLCQLSDVLNRFNKTNYSHRFWRILIGPWLLLFIEILFDRYSMIKEVLDKSKNLKVISQDVSQYESAFNDMSDLLFVFASDEWNEIVYSQIIEHFESEIEIQKIKSNINFNNVLLKKQKLKSKCINYFNKLQGIFTRDDEIFFISDYLGLSRSTECQIKLMQFPKLWRKIESPRIIIDYEMRDELIVNISEGVDDANNNDFYTLIKKLIAFHVPKTYLEGFKYLQEKSRELSWPSKPRAIFTANAFYSDDIFKHWASSKVENGSKLVTAQHGGHYGIGLLESTEEHQLKISDKYLSWGWDKKGNNSINKFGIIKPIKKRDKLRRDGNILLVLNSNPRYSYRLFSFPIGAHQNISYIDDQILFISSLNKELFKKLNVRLYSNDYGNCTSDILREKFNKINFISSKKKLCRLITKSKYFVSTSNSTSFLESLSSNIPTIVFWDPYYNEIRKSAEKYFTILENAGIFHKNPFSAAQHINATWDTTDSWWFSNKTQDAVNIFCERFVTSPNFNYANINRILSSPASSLKV